MLQSIAIDVGAMLMGIAFCAAFVTIIYCLGWVLGKIADLFNKYNPELMLDGVDVFVIPATFLFILFGLWVIGRGLVYSLFGV